MRRLLGAALILAAHPVAAPLPLAIVQLKFHEYEGGPPVRSGFSPSTGDTVFLSFQVQGFQVSPEQKIDVRCRIEPLDPQGVPLAEPFEREVKSELSPQDKDWMPLVRHSFEIPPLALGGTYRAVVSVEDKLSGRNAKTTLEFPVRGRKVEPSETLVARNFRFLHSEDEHSVMPEPVYHPGDALWARFEITGYRYGDKNGIDVEYGLAVIGPAGNQMFSQPQAAVEQGESFYPKKYLPGILSLNLDKKVRPGEYAIVLQLRDKIGGQEQESRHPFRVE